MTTPYLIAGAAGLMSALFFVSATGGNVIAVPLVYIAPLPLFLAGFGWGASAAIAAGLAGTLLLALLAGGLVAIGYFASLAAPAAILVYLALLSRQDTPQGPMEWYPAGNLVAWSAVMAGALTALTVPLLGMDAETFQASLQTILENTVFKDIESTVADQLDATQIEALKSFLVSAFPAISAVILFLSITLNMWGGGRIIESLGRGLRPWPAIENMTYPQEFSVGFVAFLIMSMMGGLLGIVATGFAGTFVVAYVLLGLAVIHAISRKTQLRPILLSMVYMGLILVGWIALVIASIGIGEPIFKLRDKFAKK